MATVHIFVCALSQALDNMHSYNIIVCILNRFVLVLYFRHRPATHSSHIGIRYIISFTLNTKKNSSKFIWYDIAYLNSSNSVEHKIVDLHFIRFSLRHYIPIECCFFFIISFSQASANLKLYINNLENHVSAMEIKPTPIDLCIVQNRRTGQNKQRTAQIIKQQQNENIVYHIMHFV